jgi:hypothetical protein
VAHPAYSTDVDEEEHVTDGGGYALRPGQAPRRAKLRDTLTGQVIDRNGHMYAGHADPKPLPVKYLQADADVALPPMTLHLHSTEEGGLGGLTYSALMAKYLGAAVDKPARDARELERREALMWWQSEYGILRVRTGLERDLPKASAAHVLEIVTTFHRERLDLGELATRFEHSASWCRKRIDWCNDLAIRHRDGCRCEACSRQRC